MQSGGTSDTLGGMGGWTDGEESCSGVCLGCGGDFLTKGGGGGDLEIFLVSIFFSPRLHLKAGLEVAVKIFFQAGANRFKSKFYKPKRVYVITDRINTRMQKWNIFFLWHRVWGSFPDAPKAVRIISNPHIPRWWIVRFVLRLVQRCTLL